MKSRYFLLLALALPLSGCNQGGQTKAPKSDSPVGVPTSKTGAPRTGTSSKRDSNEGNLLLGNPTNAGKDADNYLLERPQYSMSYNRSRGEANWVAWHIDAQDLGKQDRGNFRPDPLLPADWQISPNDYRNSGYDRGHVCPSGDRTASRKDNDATFYMSNMLPQTPELNRALWADAENALRDIVRQGNEIYVIAGGAGRKATIANGKVTVPQVCWKVAVILPEGKNDLQRINAKTRVLALAMPNVTGDALKKSDWHNYIVTTKKLSEAIKMDFFQALPASLRNALKTTKDSGD